MVRSLTQIYLQVFLIVFLCLAAAGYAGYVIVCEIQLSSYQESAAQTARETADRINALIAQQYLTLEKISRQPDIVAVLQHGSATELARKEVDIKSMLPEAITVHLLQRNNAGTLSTVETVDPASLDFIQRATTSNTQTASEFHALGTSSEHYDLVAPVRDQSQIPVGFLLVGFSPTPLRDNIEQSLPSGSYMQLQQPTTDGSAQPVLTAGTTATANGATVTSVLGSSHWTLVYQSAQTPPRILSGGRIYYFVFILLAMLIIVVVLFNLYRQTAKALRHDIRSLIRMFRDLREGAVRVDYPMLLNEFSEIFDYLRDRGQKLIEEKEKLKDMGLMDHLSQLGNRRHFELRLKELFEASKANGPSSVLIIDMDHFKAVNDKHGHDAGDALIVGFSNALRLVVRQTDVLVRLGGDEFCIIYTYAPLAKAVTLVERLRRQLPREIPLTKGVMHQLRWTGGLSAMHDKDTKPDDVLWRADQALLQAKESGRNITKVYDPVVGLPGKRPIIVS
ncbi:MAG: GGDEF domain-containing protein [Sulfuricaulis sp.]